MYIHAYIYDRKQVQNTSKLLFLRLNAPKCPESTPENFYDWLIPFSPLYVLFDQLHGDFTLFFSLWGCRRPFGKLENLRDISEFFFMRESSRQECTENQWIHSIIWRKTEQQIAEDQIRNLSKKENLWDQWIIFWIMQTQNNENQKRSSSSSIVKGEKTEVWHILERGWRRRSVY